MFVLWFGWLCIALLIPVGLASAKYEGPVWLSDDPPNEAFAQRLRRSHGGEVEMGRGGSTAKRLWFRQGGVPEHAAYPDSHAFEGFRLHMTTPAASEKVLELFSDAAGAGLHFPIPDEGYYNVFASRQRVVDGELRVEVAKHEVLRHLCSEGHDYPMSLVEPRSHADVPLEIIRLRMPDEDFHVRLYSGDTVRFRVLHYGEPTAGVRVSISSQRGWQKQGKTDENGDVSFQLIRDYYPEWPAFHRRHRDLFLVVANHQVDKAGEHGGERYGRANYTATLPGFYSPPSQEYKSYAYGLALASGGGLLAALMVYGYRRRRWHPPREEAFDERD